MKMQELEPKKLKRIQQISVTNLFGMFNHTIPLNMDDRITIIHSPNGFGKTAILKLLSALFSKKNSDLRNTSFTDFRVDFYDGTYFGAMKKHLDKEQKEVQEITFYAKDEESFPTSLPSYEGADRLTLVSLIERYVPSVSRVGSTTWLDDALGEILLSEDVLECYSSKLPADFSRKDDPQWLTELRFAVSVRLIETQRLLNVETAKRRIGFEYERQPLTPTVKIYAKELVNTIKEKVTEFASLSQSLDRTFPERVFKPTTNTSHKSDAELRRNLQALDEKRSHLMNVGLLDQEESTTFQLDNYADESKKSMLSVYVDDNQRKLSVFDELAKKIDLFTKIINSRFLYKSISIDREQGFMFKTSNNTILSLEKLSSGEQHELVLFYELLFKIKPNSLVLIDEPEISLHVVWQEQFLKDVQAVTQLADIDVLLATHSPDIIADRRDLLVELRGMKNGVGA